MTAEHDRPDAEFVTYDCRVCAAHVRWTTCARQVAAGLCSSCHHSAQHGWAEPARVAALEADLARAERERDELRAILAPLLAVPWSHAWANRREAWRCRFCQCLFDNTHVDDGHRADCPVLRRAALLGEEAAS